MFSYARDIAPLRILVLRALVGYALLRALLVLVALAARQGVGLESPLGVVLLATVLGAIDIRRRDESLFWSNLGYSSIITACVFGAVALSGELIVAWIRP